MEQSPKDNLSINIILSQVLVLCNDVHLRSGLTMGFYKSLVQKAIENLAYDTFFEKLTFDLPVDKVKLQVTMPENLFNIRELYLWNGSCCSPQNSVNVHWKRLYNNHNGGVGYTAKIKDAGATDVDPVYPQFFNLYPSNLIYGSVQNGVIMLSSNAQGFDNIRIVGNGTGGAIGDEPIIPRFLRDAIEDFCCEAYYRIQMGRDRGYTSLWQLYDKRLNAPYPQGSWAKAALRVSQMGNWAKDSLIGDMEGWGKY